MKLSRFRKSSSLGWSLILALLACANSYGQTARVAIAPSTGSVLSVDRQPVEEILMANLPEGEQKWISNMPANFYHLGAAKVGETADAQTLTIRFAATAKLGGISSRSSSPMDRSSFSLSLVRSSGG